MRGTLGIARIAELGLVGSIILSACVAPAGAAKPDTSYDQVEHSRALALGAQAAKPDTSYDQVERTRSLFGGAAKPDTSYDQVERMRGAFGR